MLPKARLNQQEAKTAAMPAHHQAEQPRPSSGKGHESWQLRNGAPGAHLATAGLARLSCCCCCCCCC